MKELFEYLMSPSHLKAYLDGFHIPTSNWGQDGTKTINELYQELKNGDCRLVEKNGVARLTWPLFVNVVYVDKNVQYECFESRNKKGRSRDLPGTFAEKRLANESMRSAIARTFTEEINRSLPQSGLSLKGSQIKPIKEWKEQGSAKSYPGLNNLSENSLYGLSLASNQGMPQAFELVEHNGTSTFDWRIIS